MQAKVQEVQAKSASKAARQAAVGVPPGMMGHVIGKARASIKAIATTSGARLAVDAPGSRGTLIIQGTERQVRRPCVCVCVWGGGGAEGGVSTSGERGGGRGAPAGGGRRGQERESVGARGLGRMGAKALAKETAVD